MRKLVASVVFGSLCFSGGTAVALDAAEGVKKACEKEIASLCSDVPEGEARLVACLYSHEDKVSSACDRALYEAAAQLGQAVEAMQFVAEECKEDIAKTCGDVPAMKGRLRACLAEHEKQITPRCRAALQQTAVR